MIQIEFVNPEPRVRLNLVSQQLARYLRQRDPSLSNQEARERALAGIMSAINPPKKESPS